MRRNNNPHQCPHTNVHTLSQISLLWLSTFVYITFNQIWDMKNTKSCCYNTMKTGVHWIPSSIQVDPLNIKQWCSLVPCSHLCGSDLRQVLYKHEGQTSLKVLDKSKSSVNLPLPKDDGYAVLEIRSWGEGGDGPAHEIIVSGDSGTKKERVRLKQQEKWSHGCRPDSPWPAPVYSVWVL